MAIVFCWGLRMFSQELATMKHIDPAPMDIDTNTSPRSVSAFDSGVFDGLNIPLNPLWSVEKESFDVSKKCLKKSSSKRRRVEFNSDVVSIVSGVSLTDEEISQCWWSYDCLQQVYAHNIALVKEMKADKNIEYINSVNFLMHSYKRKGDDFRRLLQVNVETLIEKDVRGLERRIVPELAQRRRLAHKTVMEMQQKLKADGMDGSDYGNSLLRKRSLEATQPAKQLAFRLGQADQLEARRINKEQ